MTFVSSVKKSFKDTKSWTLGKQETSNSKLIYLLLNAIR